MPPKKVRDRRRQTKINFSPASKSSPATKPSSLANMGNESSRPTQFTPTKATRSAKQVKQSKIAIAGPGRPKKRARLDSSSEDELAAETERGMQLGMPVKSTPHGMFGSSDVEGVGSESSEEEEQPTMKPTTRKRQRVAMDNDSDEDEAPRKRSRRKSAKRQVTSEEEELRTPPQSTRRKPTRRRSPTPEEAVEVKEHVAPHRRKSSRRKSTSDEETEEQTPPRSTRRRIRRRASESEEKDIGEDGAADQDDSEEQDDLKEDLAFLRSSPLPDRGRLRSTHEKPKNERQKALEALKRRRAGTNEPSSSATPGRKKQIVIESESDSELEVIKEEPDSDAEILDDDDDIEDDNEEEPEGEREANRLDMFQEDIDDEGFIDDDADATIGEPVADLDELRLTLGLSRAKPKDLFKHAVEWMVMKKIHPGFDSTRNIYTFTFRKLDDEVKGLAGSKFTSSAWGPDFTRAIKARPDLLFTELTSGMREVISPHCAACNRRSHPASWELMLSGVPYHEDTLEPVEQSSDSDSDSDNSDISADSETQLNGEKPTYNEKGERLVPESHRFFLGSTCKANAQVSHTLYHWRYHLYSWVKDYLVREGYLTAEKLVWRDRRSDAKREKEAQRIVDTMDADGEIPKLYRLYKDQVTFALEANNEYRHGWGKRAR